MGKLINRIPGSRLLISSLPGSALRTHVESLGKPRNVNNRLKPCLVNLISKGTHLVFSIFNPLADSENFVKGKGALTSFFSLTYFTEDSTNSIEKQLDPLGSIASREGSVSISKEICSHL